MPEPAPAEIKRILFIAMPPADQVAIIREPAVIITVLQGVIRRLFARRLIERRPDPTDRRRILLRLSASGAALLTGYIANGFMVSERTLETLSPSERAVLLDLLRRIS